MRDRFRMVVDRPDEVVEVFCHLLVLMVARPTTTSVIVGSVIAVVGESLRQWAGRDQRPSSWSGTRGAYRLTRHPELSGRFLRWAGMGVGAGSATVLAVGAILVGAALAWRGHRRDQEAFSKGGPWAREYEAFVPAFLPQIPLPWITTILPPPGEVRVVRRRERWIETRGSVLLAAGVVILGTMNAMSDPFVLKIGVAGVLLVYFGTRVRNWSLAKTSRIQ